MSEKSSGGLFEGIKSELEANIDARIRLLQLETTEKIARLAGIVAVSVIGGVIILLLLLCLSLMAGFYFSQLFASEFYGFALVAGFYLLLFILLMAFGRKKLATFVADSIVNIIFDKQDSKS